MEFEKIQNINVEKESSWKDKIFLTFDVEWATDEVLSYTLDILQEKNIKATFFCTHQTSLLDKMRENPNIELGIHPNFNFLLNGDFRYGKNYKEVIEYYLKIVPEAVSVRSHSLTQNSSILQAFSDFGLKYDCNLFIPLNGHIENKPFYCCNNKLIRVPYFWEDDVYCSSNEKPDINEYISYIGPKIFDFHPIHIFLNTENLSQYEKYKHFPSESYINKNRIGIKNFFQDLIKETNEHSDNWTNRNFV